MQCAPSRRDAGRLPNKGAGAFLILSKDRTHLALVGRGWLDGPPHFRLSIAVRQIIDFLLVTACLAR